MPEFDESLAEHRIEAARIWDRIGSDERRAGVRLVSTASGVDTSTGPVTLHDEAADALYASNALEAASREVLDQAEKLAMRFRLIDGCAFSAIFRVK